MSHEEPKILNLMDCLKRSIAEAEARRALVPEDRLQQIAMLDLNATTYPANGNEGRVMAIELLQLRTDLATARAAATNRAVAELSAVRGYLACTSGPAWAGDWQNAMKHAIAEIDKRLAALTTPPASTADQKDTRTL